MFNVSYSILDLGMMCYHDAPSYYDGYLQCDFPVPSLTNFRFTEQEISSAQSGYNSDGRKYKHYWLTRYVKANFDKVELEAPITIGLVVYE